MAGQSLGVKQSKMRKMSRGLPSKPWKNGSSKWVSKKSKSGKAKWNTNRAYKYGKRMWSYYRPVHRLRKKRYALRQGNGRQSTVGTLSSVGKCGIEYAKALLDPWAAPSGVCLPYSILPFPTYKVKTVLNGQFGLGTTGYGFVVMSGSGTNDGTTYALYTTAGNSALSNAQALNLATNVQAYPFTQQPYTDAQIASGSQAFRIATIGVRVQYAGPEQTRGGIMGAVEYDSIDAYSQTITQIFAQQNCVFKRPSGDGEWFCIQQSGPTQNSDLEFRNVQGNHFWSLPGTAQVCPLVIAISGTAGDIYRFQAVQHIEYSGDLLAGNISPIKPGDLPFGIGVSQRASANGATQAGSNPNPTPGSGPR